MRPSAVSAEVQDALDRQLARNARQVLPALAVFYAVLSVSHALVLPPGIRGPPAALAAATAALLLGLRALVARTPPRLANGAAALAALLVVANSALVLFLTGDPFQTTNLMISLVAAAFFLLATPWFALVAAAAGASWLVAAQLAAWGAGWRHYAFALASTTVAATLIHLAHRANRVRLESLRIANDAARREAERLATRAQESETRLRLILAAAGEGVVGLDAEGRTTFANAAALRMLHAREQDLVGERFHDVAHRFPADGRAHRADECPIHRVARLGEAARAESEAFWRVDGTCLPVRYVATPIKRDGGPDGAVVVFEAVEERERAAAKLRESEERFRRIFEEGPFGLTLLDLEGRILRANASFCRLVGRTEDELRGHGIRDVTHPDDHPADARALDDLLAGRARSVRREKRYLRKDGEVVWAKLVSALLADDEGVPTHLISMSIDITAERRAEGELARLVQEHESILQAITDVVYQIDLEGRLLRWNAPLESVTGHTADELRGRHALAFFPPDQHARVEAAIAEVLREGHATVEADLLRRDGTSIPYDFHGSLLRDAHGAPLGITGVGRDVSAQRAAQEALARALRERRAIMDATPDILYLLDAETRLVDWNRYTEEVTGYSPEELRGKEAIEFFPPEEREKVTAALVATLEKGRNSVEADLLLRDGRRAPYSFVGATVHDEDGQVTGFTGVGRDITDRRRWEDEIRRRQESLERLTAQLQAANRELESFSYTVAHDLKAPLRALLAVTEMLREDFGPQLGADGEALLRQISTEAGRMQRLVEDLLRLSRSTEGSLVPADVDLSRLAREVIGELRKGAPARQAEVQIEDGLRAEADAELARVVLENLLGNAWKYTSKKPAARIELGRLRDREPAAFFVRDNGAGFDMAKADRLFEPFQRFHHRAEFEGTGIGLATVARIVRRHGSRVWAESTPGRGTTIYFTLAPEAGAPQESR